VLIHAGAGAGGVGMAAIQFARAAGATVLSTSSSEEKLSRLAAFGLDHGIHTARQSFVDEALRLTGGRGVDVVLDSVGGKTLADSVKVLANRGRLVSVVAGRQVTGFANIEETMMGLSSKGSFLTETKLRERGGKYRRGLPFMSHVAVSERLVTGQNPRSTRAVAQGGRAAGRASARRRSRGGPRSKPWPRCCTTPW